MFKELTKDKSPTSVVNCEDLIIFSVLYRFKWNIFGFYTVDHTKQQIKHLIVAALIS